MQASLEKASIDEVFVDVTTLVEKELLVSNAKHADCRASLIGVHWLFGLSQVQHLLCPIREDLGGWVANKAGW